MKSTLLSFLNVFRPLHKVEIIPLLPEESIQNEQYSQAVQSSNAVSSEPSVVYTTTQLKKIVAFLLREAAKIRESINRLSLVRADKRLSDLSKKRKNTPEANGNLQTCKIPETSVPTMDSDVFNNEDTLVKTILDQAQAQLALSENIEDVAYVFKQLEERIGKEEFVIAIMISYICEERFWKRYGYSSMKKFLDDLPDVCKVSRQTFYNAAQAGEVIRYLSRPSCPENLRQKLDLTPAFFYQNYSKLKFLYKMFHEWNMPLDFNGRTKSI